MMAKEINLVVWFFICHIANLLDAIFTLNAVSKGVEELNPLMAFLIEQSPILFFVVKVVLFALAIDLLARRRPTWLRPVGYVYILVLIWHVSFLFVI